MIEWIEAEDIDSAATAERMLRHVDGILVPGGFGKRGIQGMVHAITYAREQKVPFFGICLGMQCATIEYARQVSKLDHADSTVRPGRRLLSNAAAMGERTAFSVQTKRTESMSRIFRTAYAERRSG